MSHFLSTDNLFFTMTQVLFAFGSQDKIRTACLIARKRYREQQPLLIWVPDRELRTQINQMLWDFDPNAFIAHDIEREQETNSAYSPILLCHTSLPQDRSYHLLNLSQDSIPPSPNISQIIELVTEDEHDKQLARQRWRFYKQQQLTIIQHDLKKTSS